MPNYVLQEMSEEMGDGKKKVYPRMQTYSLHDFNTVIRHMRDYSGSFSEGTIRGVLDALVTTTPTTSREPSTDTSASRASTSSPTHSCCSR